MRMKLEELKNNIKPLDIVIFHVGAVGDYGPVEHVVKHFAEHVVTVCFEANILEGDYNIQQQYSERGVRAFLVPKAVGGAVEKQPFYINKHTVSSSLYPPSPQAVGEHVVYGDGDITWGEFCELDRKVEVDVTTFDQAIKDNNLPGPDIVSSDAQGAELRILQGGSERAMPSVLCVVTEIEFWEIYQGQGMFCEQAKFMDERGFRLAEIFCPQYWHPDVALGKGFLTVGEALFLPDANKYRAKWKASNDKALLYEAMKLAAIAYSFRRLSYASMLVTLILEKFGEEARSLFLANKCYKPLLDLQEAVMRNREKYLKDDKFFYKTGWRRRGIAKLEFEDAIKPLLKGGPLSAMRYVETILRDIVRHILFWK
jgi:FkbM family methyltransferase